MKIKYKDKKSIDIVHIYAECNLYSEKFPNKNQLSIIFFKI